MSRATYVWREGVGLIEKQFAPPPSGVFHVIRDGMDAVAHPVTGRLMDSKSEFRKVTKAHGYVEMGDQAPKSAPRREYDSRELKRDIGHGDAEPARACRRDLRADGPRLPDLERLGRLTPMLPPPAAVVTIDADYGGIVADFARRIADYRRHHVRVRIMGECASACTLVTSLRPDRVCIGPQAVLEFHQAFLPNRFDPTDTSQRVESHDAADVQNLPGGCPGLDLTARRSDGRPDHAQGRRAARPVPPLRLRI